MLFVAELANLALAGSQTIDESDFIPQISKAGESAGSGAYPPIVDVSMLIELDHPACRTSP